MIFFAINSDVFLSIALFDGGEWSWVKISAEKRGTFVRSSNWSTDHGPWTVPLLAACSLLSFGAPLLTFAKKWQKMASSGLIVKQVLEHHNLPKCTTFINQSWIIWNVPRINAPFENWNVFFDFVSETLISIDIVKYIKTPNPAKVAEWSKTLLQIQVACDA